MIDNPKDLGKAIKKGQDSIEIEADLAKKIIKIKGVGKIAWGILLASLSIAIYSIMTTAATGGTSAAFTGTATMISSGAAVSTLGPSVTYFAVMTAVYGGGSFILTQLRKYKVEKIGNKYFLKK
ncbi:hypothetical protein MUA41_00840 [Staphylococcus simulans]|uniref:hypothetical protein n=1 Tax=Staphylococcus simulans TaxID=1286 RepID=UPI0021D3182A|nr:hypothetical protein [Staphylococcus simulans]UXR38045.1 hypothetical protein MUA41_00840 [Staphylococcus simulans]